MKTLPNTQTLPHHATFVSSRNNEFPLNAAQPFESQITDEYFATVKKARERI